MHAISWPVAVKMALMQSAKAMLVPAAPDSIRLCEQTSNAR